MTVSAPPDQPTAPAAPLREPPGVVRGLWLLAGALILLLFWAYEPVLAAVACALFATAVFRATATAPRRDPARFTALAVVGLAVLAVAGGEAVQRPGQLVLLAGVVAAVVWMAADWKRRFVDVDETLHGEWSLLHRRGLQLLSALVFTAGLTWVSPAQGPAWTGLALLVAALFLFIWCLEALRVLSTTARAVGDGGPRRSMVPAGVLVAVLGYAAAAWGAGSVMVTEGRMEMRATEVVCELDHRLPWRGVQTTATGVVAAQGLSDWEARAGAYQVRVSQRESHFDPPRLTVAYEVRAEGLRARLVSPDARGDDEVAVGGGGLGRLVLACRATPPG